MKNKTESIEYDFGGSKWKNDEGVVLREVRDKIMVIMSLTSEIGWLNG